MIGLLRRSSLLLIRLLVVNLSLCSCFENEGIGLEVLDFGNSRDNASLSLLNVGESSKKSSRERYETQENSERLIKQVDIQSSFLKLHIDRLKNQKDQVELVFLVDSSGSVGITNFRSELDFVKKLLADFTVKPSATRVALVTFSGKDNIRREIDQISRTGDNDHKCYLLNKQLNNITYTGGGTYTRGALMEALMILEKGRVNAKKVVFLITDGYSNGGDPRPAANLLKSINATIFTFAIRTGNVVELHDIASNPGYTHSYFLDSFAEFQALARRALHRDLKTGTYVQVRFPDNCNTLCGNDSLIVGDKNCCDDRAVCICGASTGHYACQCPVGFFGSGLKGSCHACPNGTYASGENTGDSTAVCVSCPDVNHVTVKVPATSVGHCVCASGFITDKDKCEAITCPKLKIPENGYVVKASACSNVVHAACGVRCKIGFHLTGDSIRLCGKNGSWSGNEPKCFLKTCAALRAPVHGRIRCQHEDDHQYQEKDDLEAYPIDTRCQFRCDTGFQLRGSKVRNCLPLSQWDGLKATCKAIKCEPLATVANGEVKPDACRGPEKVLFSTKCSITCRKGFELEGPRTRVCGGRNGVWTQRHNINRCVDKLPPLVTCPSDIIVENIPSENYAYVNWVAPNVTDNVDKSPTLWTKPHVLLPWKVKIGTRTIIYIAQDSSGNRARCKFKIRVLDKEPPMIENCFSPPIMYTHTKYTALNVSWDEPGFYDNSKTPVLVEQTHRPGESLFLIGETSVVYKAIDKYNNTATCTINITVKDVCEEIPAPWKGYISCLPTDYGKECVLSCEEGYSVVGSTYNISEENKDLVLICNKTIPVWKDDNSVPDCSESYAPKKVFQEGGIVLESNATDICDNRTTLRELSDFITEDLRSTLLDMCGNDIDCDLISFDPECKGDPFEPDIIYSNTVRRRRETIKIQRNINSVGNKTKERIKFRKKKEKIEIQFKFVGRIISDNYDNPKMGLEKLRKKFEELTNSGMLNLLNNRTNQKVAELALNLHLLFKDPQELCDEGSILRKHSCIKCPMGTFHNASTKRCQPCPYDQYQNISGSIQCKLCPQKTSTKRMRSKFLHDCIPLCRPGHYSRRKRNQEYALEPCLTCDFGFYQSKFGQTHCLACPSNTSTRYRGASNVTACLYLNEANICQAEPCQNGGQCVAEDETFNCECPSSYVGAKCETYQSACVSSPCLNEGVCTTNFSNSSVAYSCTCKSGYKGANCETYIDECSVNPCQNGGKCLSTENDYVCECKDSFIGEFCQISLNYCDPSPCEEGSTCRTINETWHCLCKPGFLGRHCNLLPCDWLPCHNNSICINLEEENATRQSYRCECPEGYTGDDCDTKINYCESSPCLNNGICINGIENYTCICRIPYTGRSCETELHPDYVMEFSRSGTTDYVMTGGPQNDLLEVSVCLWLQSKDVFNYGTVLSYATRYHDNTFALTDYNGFVLYVNGEKVVTDIKANDGKWHFLCVTWKSKNGTWNIYLDGIWRDGGANLARASVIPGNGSLVIGQDQDRMGGGFSESESYLGKLCLLDIWDKILEHKDVKYLQNTCKPYYGNVIAWAQLRKYIQGDVMVSDSTFCRGCPLPATPFKGGINITDGYLKVTYFCDTGYTVRFRGKEYESLELKCLKQGQWEGNYSPSCISKTCGFPGHFPRGRIQGKSYSFGDQILYVCAPGYELRGNPHRICNSNGKWSGRPPICIGRTCKNLLAPENGDIEYILEENERDDISILQVGQQLEFRCNPGFRLDGEQYLTCLDSGVWDHDRPYCVPNGCPAPKEIKHSLVRLVSSKEKINETIAATPTDASNILREIYNFGDIVGYSCYKGYKFSGTHNLVAEFKLQCTSNGVWHGFVPDCISLQCPWPNITANEKVFLITKDNSSIELQPTTSVNRTLRKNGITGDDVNTLVVGTRIMRICEAGFKLVGNDISLCTEGEKWSPSSFCEQLECPIMDHAIFKYINLIPSNGTENNTKISSNITNYSGTYGNMKFFIKGNVYDDYISLTCINNGKLSLEGLSLNQSFSNFTWLCGKNGIWEQLNSPINNSQLKSLLNSTTNGLCEKLTCDSPKAPQYGYVVDNNESDLHSSNINKTIIFKCRQGYLLQGSEKSVCLKNGTWSSAPTCKPVECSKPPILANSLLKENNTATKIFSYGNMITYQCIPGYILYGQAHARCLANGKWSKVYGKCSKLSCNKPKLPPGVTIQGQSYLYQDQLTYICPDGKKRGLITCKADGEWSDLSVCNYS